MVTLAQPPVATPPEAPVLAAIKRGGPELIDDIAAEWAALVAESGCDEPFFRPEWVRAFLVAFSAKERLVLLTVRIAGRLRAVLPLLERDLRLAGIKVRALTGAANIHSCRFDLICARGRQGDIAVHAIWDLVRRDLPWDVVILPDVPTDGAAHALLRVARDEGFSIARWETVASPYVELHPRRDKCDVAEFAHTSHFRQNLRRRWRNLSRRGELLLQRRPIADPGELARFYALESSGWKGEEGGAIACSPQVLRFYNEVARAAERGGYFALYSLQCGNETVAAHFGLAYKGRYYCPKVAYAPAFHDCSPGHLLTGSILCDIAKQGFTRFDFAGNNDAWKAEWSTGIQQHETLFVFGRGIRAQLAYAALFRIVKPMRDLLRRAGLRPAWARLIVNTRIWVRRLRGGTAGSSS